MQKLIVFLLLVVAILAIGFDYRYFTAFVPNEKIYVAVEGDGLIAVIDPAKQKVMRNIDLSIEHAGQKLVYAPHNVQVSPDNKSVWVTANTSKHESHTSSLVSSVYAHGEDDESLDEPDVVVVFDPLTDKIIKRIAIAPRIHLAHVVLSHDNAYAFVVTQKEGAIYKINAQTFEVEKRVLIKEGGEPHGIRMSPDSSYAYIALLKGKSLGILNVKTDELTEVPLGGAAVQTGVTPDGKFVFASLYDTKQLAVYQTDTKQVHYVDLPETARGPVQMYPTPDSRFVYLADQGYYFEQPANEWVYKIDVVLKKVVREIKTGNAPHGVVVSRDGKTVYITNLLSNDVSFINSTDDKEIARIKVGKEPNGISVWSKQEN